MSQLAGRVPGLPFLPFVWQAYGIVMLGLSTLILVACVRSVRRVALQQAVGETETRKRKSSPSSCAGASAASGGAEGRIRPVTGSPVVWKELHERLIRNRRRTVVVGSLILVLLVLFYRLLSHNHILDEDGTQTSFVVLFLLVGSVYTMVLSATNISSEKESGCWPLLLSTTLTNGQLILGKAVGTMRRCMPAWALLAGHVAFFTMVRYIHVALWLHLAMLIAIIIVFFTGTGLYLGTRFRHTTSAVVTNMGIAFVLWLLLPMVLGIVGQGRIVEALMMGNPIVLSGIVTNAAAGTRNAAQPLSGLVYHDIPMFSPSGFGDMTLILLAVMAVYLFVGLACGYLAWKRIRRNIY
jgi:ABC-type transport system involved in multi-copper enzyme maturation permease subunit